jgi:L-gulonolactone oxidase
MPKEMIYNESRQFSCRPKKIFVPENTAELAQQLESIRKTSMSLRLVGGALSPSDMAMSNDALIRMDQFNKITHINQKNRTITVQPGATLHKMNQALAAANLAMPVLGSITKQTIGGAVATGTHGTGINVGSLSTLVASARLLTVEGDWIDTEKLDKTEGLNGIALSLGSLGIVAELTLNVSDAFNLSVTEAPNTLENVLENLQERLLYDHYRFWYIPHADRVWEWQATRCAPTKGSDNLTIVQRLRRWYDEKLINYHCFQFLLYISTHMPSIVPAINRWTAQKRFNTPKNTFNDSVSQFTFDCLFQQHVNEWSIPIEKTPQALTQLRDLIAHKGYKVHMPIEVRFVKGDDLWLSPCQGRDSCYIGVIAYTPYGKQPEYQAYFQDVEKLMLSLGGRPHWAKYFSTEGDKIAASYPHWQDFQMLRKKLDPHYRLRNAFTERVLDSQPLDSQPLDS